MNADFRPHEQDENHSVLGVYPSAFAIGGLGLQTLQRVQPDLGPRSFHTCFMGILCAKYWLTLFTIIHILFVARGTKVGFMPCE